MSHESIKTWSSPISQSGNCNPLISLRLKANLQIPSLRANPYEALSVLLELKDLEISFLVWKSNSWY